MLREMQRPLVACLLPIIPTVLVAGIMEVFFPAATERSFYSVTFKIGVPVATYLVFLALIFFGIKWLRDEKQESCSTDAKSKKTEHDESEKAPYAED